MKSEYENSLAQEAVKSVERRWERQNAIRRRAERRRTMGNVFVIAFLVLALACAAIIVLRMSGLSEANGGGLSVESVKKMFLSKGVGVDADAVACYAKAMALFMSEETALWRDAPAQARPSSAERGTICHVLVEADSDRHDMYEVVSSGDGGAEVRLLSPFARPTSTTLQELSKRCKGKKCFIAHDGVVYVAGSTDLTAATVLTDRIRRYFKK